MFSARRHSWLVIALAAFAAAPSLAAPDERPSGTIEPASAHAVRIGDFARQAALSAGPVWRAFQARHGGWRASWNEITGSPHRAFGPPIALQGVRDDAASVDQAVRAFVAGHADVFGTPALATDAVVRANGIWYVRYHESVGGVPVLNADWEFRVSPGGALFAFGADVHRPAAAVSTTPTLVRAAARAAATEGLAFQPGTDRVEDSGMGLLPWTTAAGTTYRLVYRERILVRDPPGNWDALVDAASGELLWRHDRVRTDITGTVTAQVHLNLPTDALTARPDPDLTVVVGGGSANTDATGAYHATASGTVTVSAVLGGLFAGVVNNAGANASFSTTVANPAVVNIAWDGTNSTDAERDGYYHVNVVHHYVKTLDPAFIGDDYAMPCTVNIASTCNAFWDGTGVNFYAAGGGCPNTATMPDVVYHEYGHSINDNLYIQAGAAGGMFNGALHEGMADVNAGFLQDTPDVGKGFFGPGTVLRHLDNTKHYPEDLSGDPHATGLIIGGAFWDLRQAVGLAIAQHLAHFAKYGTPDDPDDGLAMSEYFLETLIADDNDSNLTNGTPHAAAIIAAFNAHGIGTGFFIAITHDPLADQPGSAPYPVTATIQYTGPIGALNASSPKLHYSINGAAFQGVSMTPTGNPNEFTGNIPGQTTAIVRYYIDAADTYGGTTTLPAVAPTRSVFTFLAGPTSTVFFQNMESNPGYTVGAPGDNAVTGIWTRVDPVGTTVPPGNGAPCQPEFDHTPGSGTVCWITGQQTVGDTDPGSNDVDGGKTTLTSNTFDAVTGIKYPVIEYYRWYTNNLGNNPSEDYWRTYLSNDGGTTWVPVENTTDSDNSWRRELFFIHDYLTPTTTMRLRFAAQDSAGPSLVEAGVDDVRLFGYPTTLAVGDGTTGGGTLALAPPAPNPFTRSAELRITIPKAGPATLAVYDLGGRMVRALVRGALAAGEHAYAWDGRDDRGRRVPSGPYFVRFSGTSGTRVAKIVRVE